MKHSTIFCVLVAITCVAVMAAAVLAAVPTLISYQGRLTDTSGIPITGTYTIQFAIYTSSGGGTYVWEETQSNVPVNDGLFNVLLGSIAPIADTVFNEANRYLGIKVGVAPEMVPRTRLVSVPYSNRVASVDGANGGNVTSKLTVGSGHANTGDDAFVAGYSNTVSGPQSSACGGRNNEVSGGSSVISGGEQNYAPGSYTVISGGIGNEVDGTSGAIGGGDSNRVYSDGLASVISGGRQNSARDSCSTVGEGSNNQAVGIYSVVAGGGGSWPTHGNTASGIYSTISGGRVNTASEHSSSVAGGELNHASGVYSFVGGGMSDTASGHASTIAGGRYNVASGSRSAIGGGTLNVASGSHATVPGGENNIAGGDCSLAAGSGAKALHEGCFVWHDATLAGEYQSVDSNQFMVYASGGIFLSGSGIKSQFGAGPNTDITKGTYYMDNSIVAWGKVSGGSGAIGTNEFGVTSVVRNSAGNYTITLDDAASVASDLIPVANAEIDVAPNSAATMRFVTINQRTAGTFDVYVTNGTFTPTDNDFVFIVTAR